MSSTPEEILVLYGSQTGNSEQAAEELCEQIPIKLMPLLHAKNKDITVNVRHMQLDDFLEMERAPWTRLVVIMTSSYGVGAAPLGCYRFRELTDAILDENKTNMLTGITYAMLGLGDSMYTTYFDNPTAIDKSMKLAGAKRIGSLGEADASGVGEEAQLNSISKWIDGIWPVLAKFLLENEQEQTSNERLQEIQQETVKLCAKINPDFLPVSSNKTSKFLLPLLVALFAIVAAWYLYL